MDAVLNWLSAFNGKISKLGLGLAGLLTGMMAITVGCQIFFRYVLNNSLSWAEDLSLMCLVWSAFLIVPVAYRASAHVSIELIVDMLPRRIMYLIKLMTHLLVFLFALYFISIAWDFSMRSTIKANAMPFQMRYVYMIMPATFTLLLPIVAEMFLRSALGFLDPRDARASLDLVLQPTTGA